MGERRVGVLLPAACPTTLILPHEGEETRIAARVGSTPATRFLEKVYSNASLTHNPA